MKGLRVGRRPTNSPRSRYRRRLPSKSNSTFIKRSYVKVGDPTTAEEMIEFYREVFESLGIPFPRIETLGSYKILKGGRRNPRGSLQMRPILHPECPEPPMKFETRREFPKKWTMKGFQGTRDGSCTGFRPARLPPPLPEPSEGPWEDSWESCWKENPMVKLQTNPFVPTKPWNPVEEAKAFKQKDVQWTSVKETTTCKPEDVKWTSVKETTTCKQEDVKWTPVKETTTCKQEDVKWTPVKETTTCKQEGVKSGNRRYKFHSDKNHELSEDEDEDEDDACSVASLTTASIASRASSSGKSTHREDSEQWDGGFGSIQEVISCRGTSGKLEFETSNSTHHDQSYGKQAPQKCPDASRQLDLDYPSFSSEAQDPVRESSLVGGSSFSSISKYEMLSVTSATEIQSISEAE